MVWVFLLSFLLFGCILPETDTSIEKEKDASLLKELKEKFLTFPENYSIVFHNENVSILMKKYGENWILCYDTKPRLCYAFINQHGYKCYWKNSSAICWRWKTNSTEIKKANQTLLSKDSLLITYLTFKAYEKAGKLKIEKLNDSCYEYEITNESKVKRENGTICFSNGWKYTEYTVELKNGSTISGKKWIEKKDFGFRMNILPWWCEDDYTAYLEGKKDDSEVIPTIVDTGVKNFCYFINKTDTCFLAMAVHYKDPKACEKIKNETLKESCLSFLASRSQE